MSFSHVQLKAFHAVAVVGSFNKAAERLRLTQPAISIQIRNLEHEAGTVLFRRDGHSVSLTEAGRSLFEVTSRIFEAETEARALLEGRGDGFNFETIHLGADGPHAALELIAKTAEFKPNIRFRVTMANAAQTLDNLLSLKVDAAVTASTYNNPKLVIQPFSKQRLTALVPSDHSLAHMKEISLSELVGHPVIFREPGSNTQEILNGLLHRERLELFPKYSFGSREAVKEAVARRLGIGFAFSKGGFFVVAVGNNEGSFPPHCFIIVNKQRKNESTNCVAWR